MAEEASQAPRVLSRVTLAEIERTNRLLADYLAGNAAVTGLFAHLPAESAALAAATQAGAERAHLSAALTEFQQNLGADAHAIRNAQLLADPTTPVVTVGQQPGLLTGPLYTPLKAMTAINLAHRLSHEIGRPVVPVFWVGTDDDDRGEADHCGWWDRQQVPQAIRYPATAGEPGQLIGDLPAGGAGDEVLSQVLPLLDGCPFGEEVAQVLRETLDDSPDLGTWFCRLMSRLFSRRGLVLCDPRLPALRRSATKVLRREIVAPLRTTDLVNTRARVLRQRGYHPALTKPETVCNVFLLAGGKRHRVTFADGAFHVGTTHYRPEEFLALLLASPERFLPSAVLRPVVQEYLFRSAAFVAGPHELGYWAELQPVFAALGVAMPPVVPRAAATLVPHTIARHLSAWGIAPLDLYTDYDATRFALAARAHPQTQQAFTKARRTIEQLLASLTGTVTAVDRTLAQSTLATQQRLLHEIERLEHKTLKAVERQQEAYTVRLAHAREVLFPAQGLQERQVNLFSVLARQGWGLIDHLYACLDRQEGQHLFVEL